MSALVLATTTAAIEPLPGMAGSVRALGAVVLVLGLLAVLAWLARRGSLRLPGMRRHTAVSIESATALGERRSLVIVTVEGRRLLLGLTPTHVSLVTELAQAARPFAETLDRRLEPTGPPS
jgi:flagellar protein FliO/FliZ